MTLRTKLVVVAVVLTAGTTAALCFRRPVTQSSAEAQYAAVLPLRNQEGTTAAASNATTSVPQGVPLPESRGTAAVASVERPQLSDPLATAKSFLSPPQLPPAFKPDGLAPAAQETVDRAKLPAAPLPDLRGSTSIPAGLPIPAPRSQDISTSPIARPAEAAPWRSHTVVDGDTLSSLATRYLGSAGRYAELLEANRNQLRSADMLPIGMVLRIPPQSIAAASTAPGADVGNQFPHLVPIPAGALTRRDALP